MSFYHVLTNAIITERVERDVITLAVVWPKKVRESTFGKTGNRTLHTWGLDHIYFARRFG